jgi:hypothetical protein
MPRVSNQAKRMKMMALEREAKRAEREGLQSDPSLPLTDEHSDDEDDSQIFQEEVYDEEGDVFLDSDGVMEAKSFMSKFSFTSSSSTSSSNACNSSLTARGSVYNFNSKRTKARRRAEQKELVEAAKDTFSIQNYFKSEVKATAVPSIFDEELSSATQKEVQEEEDWTEMKLPPEAALVLIDEMNIMSNAKKDVSSIINAQFEVKRATAVRAYLLEWHNKKDDFRQMQESEKIATVIYNTTTSVCYRAKMIRYWAKYFLQYGEFPPRKIGIHMKIFPAVLDEDISLQCLRYVRSLDKRKRQMFTSKQFSNWVNSNIPSIQISERTARRWLHHLGLNFEDVKRANMYVDGHEREDVLRYRKHFVQLMLGWRDRMSTYDEKDTMIPPKPEVLGLRKELVLVVHDVCCSRWKYIYVD